MFGLFKKKSELEKLQQKHKGKLEEAFRLSQTNRAQSDQCYAEADLIMKEIIALEKGEKN